MKKLFSILLVCLMLTVLLASCGTPVNTNTDTETDEEANVNAGNTNTDTNESKSLYELAVEAGFEGTLEEWCEAVANVNDTSEDEPKSLYELAVEAGFEGTLEEWCEAIANVEKPNITLADAIIIAQTHYFAVYYTDSSNEYYMVDVAEELYKKDTENWYIIIAPKDVFDDDEMADHLGRAHIYVISKETGTILEIDASGE